MDITSYLLSKKYTNDSLDGAGAIKGAPCRISKIEPIEGGNKITFAWTSNSGVESTNTLIVKDGVDGEQGNGIIKVEKIKTVDLIDTYRMTFDDGSTFDYEITNGGGSIGESQIVFSKLADFPAIGESDKVYIDTDASKSYIFINNDY